MIWGPGCSTAKQRGRESKQGGGVMIFSLKLFCIAELSLHAEFKIHIKFCGGWSTASNEAESPSKGGGSGDPNFFL